MITRPFFLSIKHLRITLLWPIFISALSAVLFTTLFGLTSGILQHLVGTSGALSSINQLTSQALTFFQNHYPRVLISFAIFFLLYFVAGTGLFAIRLGLTKDILEGREQGLFRGFFNALHYGRDQFWNVLLMRVITFVINGLLIGIFIWLFYTQTLTVRAETKLILFTFFILITFFVGLILFFRYAYLFLRGDHVFTAIYHSMIYFFNRRGYTFIAFLIVSALTLGRAFIQNIIPTGNIYSVITFGLFLLIYSVFLSMWQDLFIFFAFTHRLPQGRAQQ